MDITRMILYFPVQNTTEYWKRHNETWTETTKRIGSKWEQGTFHYFEMTCTQDEYTNRNKATIPV